MLDKNSDYVYNKYRYDAIVYISVIGVPLEIKKDMFFNEEEFLKWKQWSDTNYYYDAKNWSRSRRLLIRLNLLNTYISLSAEDEVFAEMSRRERVQKQDEMLQQIRDTLTEKQYRRLLMYFIARMTERQIAEFEGVSQQRISAVIIASTIKIKKILKVSYKQL